MAEIADLRDDVRPAAPSAVIPEVDDAILRALISFCRTSRIWTDTVDQSLTAEQSEYRLRGPGGGRFDQILACMYSDAKRSNMPVRVISFKELSVRTTPRSQNVPTFVALNAASNRLTVYPPPKAPAEDGPTLKLHGVFVPQRRSGQFPDFIREEWYEGIVHGAMAMLYGMKDKPWTDHRLAAREKRGFDVQTNKAKREASTENWTRQRVVPRQRY